MWGPYEVEVGDRGGGSGGSRRQGGVFFGPFELGLRLKLPPNRLRKPGPGTGSTDIIWKKKPRPGYRFWGV
jgi:hypothetical protein